MTTNLTRWLQAALVCGLFGVAIWQASVASGMASRNLTVAHLVLASFLIVPGCLLIFHKAIGTAVFNRATTLAFLAGGLWFGLQSVNGLVLRGVVPVMDLLWAGGCLLGFAFELATMRWNERAEEYLRSWEPAPEVPFDPLPTERGVYYPD